MIGTVPKFGSILRILRNQRGFLESFFLGFDLEVFYHNLFFRKSLIKNKKTLDSGLFTPKVLWIL